MTENKGGLIVKRADEREKGEKDGSISTNPLTSATVSIVSASLSSSTSSSSSSSSSTSTTSSRVNERNTASSPSSTTSHSDNHHNTHPSTYPDHDHDNNENDNENDDNNNDESHPAQPLRSVTRPLPPPTVLLLPVESGPPTCLELLHRLCVGPARSSSGSGCMEVEGESEGEHRREREGEEGRAGLVIDTHCHTHSQNHNSEELKEGYSKSNSTGNKSKLIARKKGKQSDRMYTDPHSGTDTPPQQPDCDSSQKIGFTKQLEFIHKLTDLVDRLRFVDRPLRNQMLCDGLTEINESPNDLGEREREREREREKSLCTLLSLVLLPFYCYRCLVLDLLQYYLRPVN